MQRPTLLAPALLAAAAALHGGIAHAVPEYHGDHGLNPEFQHESISFFGGTGFELDGVYLFQLDRPHVALASAVSNQTLPEFGLHDAMLTLWRSNGDFDFGNDELIGGFDFGASTVSQRFEGLGAGDYFWRLQATVQGVHGGSLLFSSAVAAVPEPGSYALMVAGLAAMGGYLRRRRGN